LLTFCQNTVSHAKTVQSTAAGTPQTCIVNNGTTRHFLYCTHFSLPP